MRTEEENRLFRIDQKLENPHQQKGEKMRRKLILDTIADW